jgi:hypothetical protein
MPPAPAARTEPYDQEVIMIDKQPANGTVTETPLPSRRTDALLGTLAERIGGRFGASSVFGAPSSAKA